MPCGVREGFRSIRLNGFKFKAKSKGQGQGQNEVQGQSRPPSLIEMTESSESDSSQTSESRSKKKDKDSESEIRELFKIFDKNHDNTISCGELGKMLRCMGMDVAEADVANIMKELDKNGNGKIEYREFKTFMQEEMRRSEESPQEQERAIRMAFQVFDKNGDGVIDARELKSAMKNLGEPLSDKELTDMMREADVDKDGKINYDEFIKIWLESANK